MAIHSMRADGWDAPRYFYFTCNECGLAGFLRSNEIAAQMDERSHLEAKAAAERLHGPKR